MYNHFYALRMVCKGMGSKSLSLSVRYSIASLAQHSRFSKERIVKIYCVSAHNVYAVYRHLANHGMLEDVPRLGWHCGTNQD